METRLVHNRPIRNFTKTRKWVRMQNIYLNLNEYIAEKPQTKEKFILSRLTLSQELSRETSLDNMEDGPRQQRCTLATRNTKTYRDINGHMRSDEQKAKRKPSEEETLERGSANPMGELQCNTSSNGTGMVRRTRTKGESKEDCQISNRRRRWEGNSNMYQAATQEEGEEWKPGL